MRLAIGLASGLGNAVFMLPAIKALKGLGHRVALYVQTDFPTIELWRRCSYADEVHDISEPVGEARLVAGQWMPPAWKNRAELRLLPRFQIAYPYTISEARSNLRLAEYFGYTGELPDISEWCKALDRTPRWDVGIVPGCKGGIWLRKRWPGLAAVAEHFILAGRNVAVFGLESDGVNDIPGEHIRTERIETLPDALARCRLIIGTDSGVAHLASSLGIPTVMIFTATSEIKGQPVGPCKIITPANVSCRPCQSTQRWQQCADWKCRSIDQMSVIKAGEALIHRL